MPNRLRLAALTMVACAFAGTIARLATLSVGGDTDQIIVENFDGAKTLLKSVTGAPQITEPKSP